MCGLGGGWWTKVYADSKFTFQKADASRACTRYIFFSFSFLQFMLGSTRSIWHSRACEI